MLRIAVQAKGRLFEETMTMLEESSIKVESGKRTLLVKAKNFPVEILYLRDDDIPQAVATGIADVGIVEEVHVPKLAVGVVVDKCPAAGVRLQVGVLLFAEIVRLVDKQPVARDTLCRLRVAVLVEVHP